jgi:hypothetical protein
MTSRFLILLLVFLAQLSLAQSSSQQVILSPSCSTYATVETDDFSGKTLIKTNSMRVGNGIWLASSKIGSEKKLILTLVFSGSTDQEIDPAETHLFSLDTSSEKIILELTPEEVKSPVSQTYSSGGTEYLAVSISTTTTYEMTYTLSEEAYDLFLTHPLSAIKINSLSSDFPFKADRKGRLKAFRNSLACIR